MILQVINHGYVTVLYCIGLTLLLVLHFVTTHYIGPTLYEHK